MVKTKFVCEKCGEETTLPAHGWLIADREFDEKAKPGQMFIRCPEHLTAYALERARLYSRNIYEYPE